VAIAALRHEFPHLTARQPKGRRVMSGSSPTNVLLDIAGGYVLPRCLHVVADLGVADALGDSPRTGRELAAAVGVDADAIVRILRLLSAHGVFVVHGDAFAHTPASQLLCSDHPQSMHALVRMFGLSIFLVTQGARASLAYACWRWPGGQRRPVCRFTTICCAAQDHARVKRWIYCRFCFLVSAKSSPSAMMAERL
jgi:hypothetical protein